MRRPRESVNPVCGKGGEVMKAKQYIRIKESPGDKILLVVINTFLMLCTVAVLYPLIYILSASFSTPYAVVSGKVWLYPVDVSLLGYEVVLKNAQVLVGFGNSFFYAFFGSLFSVIITIMMAYPLSRKTFYGRNMLMFLLTFTMLFGGGMIPLYLVVKNLHLLDTRWVSSCLARSALIRLSLPEHSFRARFPTNWEKRQKSTAAAIWDFFCVS